MQARNASPHPKWLLPLMSGIAALLVVVPFLFWHQTWFGRELSGGDIEQYLQDDDRPRRIQHALTQVSERILRGDPEVKAWYPRIVELSSHATPQIRTTAAWVMGQDNTSPVFHRALIAMMQDPDVMVRRNAALSLVRFADGRGRGELVAALRPLAVRAPSDGTLSLEAQAGQQVGRGTLLGRIASKHGQELEVRSPYAGRVEELAAADQSNVTSGDHVLSVGPEPGQAWEVLRALYLVGQAEDLDDVTRFGAGPGETPDRLRQQAVLTAQAIRNRSARNPSR
jgi:biotin carboxyl carrier protein